MHSSIRRRILAQFHGTVFGFVGFYNFHIVFPEFQLFGLSMTEETWKVEIRIWCIKIGIALVLHSLKICL